MTHTERRTDRRLPLHLPVSPMPQEPSGAGSWVTGDISPGGMYVRVPAAEAPPLGSDLDFVLAVPPGDGYSAQLSRICGSGRIVRIEDLGAGQAGLGVQFAAPLTMPF